MAAPLAVVVGETVPHGAGEHDTVQVTPLLAGSLVTVAVNGAVVPAITVADWGATETAVARTVMVAMFVFDESATEAAVIVTVKAAESGVVGAV